MFEQRPGGAGRALRADLLVVEQGDDAMWPPSAAASASASTAAQHETWLSSRPLASSEPSAPSTAGAVRSYRHSSHDADVAVAGADLLGQPVGELARPAATPEPHTGREVLLLVEHQAALVDVAVEVDRQLRHAADRLVDAHIERSVPSSSTTRPAMPRSRSSHELMSAPP